MSQPPLAAPLDDPCSKAVHELNQPLTAMTLYLQAAVRMGERQQGLPPDVLDLIRKALHEAERAGAVVVRLRHALAEGNDAP